MSNRIALLLTAAAVVSCTLFYANSRHEYVLARSTSRRTRTWCNSSGVELTDADGLLIEVAPMMGGSAAKRSIDEEKQVDATGGMDATGQLSAFAKEHTHHEAIQRVKGSKSSKVIMDNSSTASAQQSGVETTDSYGLLVEVAAQPLGTDETKLSRNNMTTTTTNTYTFKQTRIINGISTPRSRHPFLVRLHASNPGQDPDQSPSTFFCGGTLISPDVILTAAHCIGNESYVDIYSVDEEKSISYKVIRSVTHPRYTEGYFGYDYALILIESRHIPVSAKQDENGSRYWDLVNEYDWKDSPPIMRLHRYEQTKSCASLSRGESKQVTTMTVMGFGRTSYPDGPISYTSLRTADVHYLSNEECNEMYLKAPPSALASRNTDVVVTPDMMCANDVEEMQDACSGDSGGALLSKLPVDGIAEGLWTVVGLISWGIGCALSSFPGVYSRVAAEVDWIEGAICHKNNGLSPMSCINDGYGVYRLRDYSAEAAVRTAAKDLSRQPAESEKNTFSSSRLSQRKRVRLSFSFNTSSSRQSTIKRYACELLEGAAPLTDRPTPKPTSRSDQNSPTKVGLNLNVRCSRTNKKNVRYFFTQNNKVKNCRWVESKCRIRCVKYSSCCPQTCSQGRCQK